MSDESVRKRVMDAYERSKTEPGVYLGDFSQYLPPLLDCGFCYEEDGEEVHPHPECPIGKWNHAPVVEQIAEDLEAVDGMVDNTILFVMERGAPAVGRQIAYRIRAELVCCDIYQRVQDGEVKLSEVEKLNNHVLCYWGEASARIAENTGQWKDDPHDHDFFVPTSAPRRQRRGES